MSRHIAGRPLDKKAAILSAMLDLITKNGFHATPMSLVAQQANVAAGTIYHYFDSKEQLIDELYALHREKVSRVIVESDEPQKPYRDRFRAVFMGLYNYYVRHIDQFLFIEQYANSPIINKISREESSSFYQPLVDFLRKGIHTSQLKDVSSKLMARLVYGNVVSLVKLNLSGELPIDHNVLNTALSASWDGVRR